MASEQKQPVLLSRDVVPSRYVISLDVDLEKFSFEGEETIFMEVTKATRTIELHSRELHVKSVSFKGSDGKSVTPLEHHFNLEQQDGKSAFSVSFLFKEDLPAGAGELAVTFTGCLNNQMAGFYRSNYTAINGETRVMASTQFEALDARRAFLCVDEPDAKASFDITLIVADDRTAFSNMPEVESTVLANGRKRIHFMETPKMSTYLVAFCVGEFDFVQTYTKGGVQVRVYTPPGKADTGRFSLDVAEKTLDLYDDYFKIPYPLPKLDMVAIPEFAMGAMENWGLVTYREVDVLISPSASNAQKQRVCTVVTHELAHQWFGNLVTMKWWDDLWLNEGFASWMQTYAADSLFPDWKMWEQFTTDDQAAALRMDALKTSHPIQVPIGHAEEVEEVFDIISYCKGASVVRMIHAVLGAEAFQKGLQLYMQQHKYGNTITTDLWAAWAKASGKNVLDLMGSWTNKMGYPVVTCSMEGDKIKVAQEWFLADGSKGDDRLWNVPVICRGQTSTDIVNEIITTKEASIAVPPSDGWYKVNFGQHVPLRVNYSQDMFAALLKGLEDKTLPAEDRAGLVSDTLALAKAGTISCTMLVDAVKACLKNERDYTVWEALEAAITQVYAVVAEDASWAGPFSTMVSSGVAAAFEQIGWDSRPEDGHLDGLLRGLLIRLLAKYSTDEGVVAEATRRFESFVKDSSTSLLPSDYKASVFKIVLKTSSDGKAVYDQLIQVHNGASLAADRKPVYFSLGAVPDLALKKKVLEWAVSGDVKLQDFFYPMKGVSDSGPEGSEMAFAFFKENFERIQKMLETASPSLMNAVIIYCCGSSASAARADELEQFFEEHPLPLSARRISQLLETIRVSSSFGDRLKSDCGGKCPF